MMDHPRLDGVDQRHVVARDLTRSQALSTGEGNPRREQVLAQLPGK